MKKNQVILCRSFLKSKRFPKNNTPWKKHFQTPQVKDRVLFLGNANACGNPHIKNKFGTIIYINKPDILLIEFDENIDGHDGKNNFVYGKSGHCWWVQSKFNKYKIINDYDKYDNFWDWYYDKYNEKDLKSSLNLIKKFPINSKKNTLILNVINSKLNKI